MSIKRELVTFLFQVITILGQDGDGETETIQVEVLDEDHLQGILVDEQPQEDTNVVLADDLAPMDDGIDANLVAQDGDIRIELVNSTEVITFSSPAGRATASNGLCLRQDQNKSKSHHHWPNH